VVDLVRPTVPDRGHLIWITFDPQVGHEQAGRRPALVLSGAEYNGPAGLCVVCPITSQVKGYPFEVRLPAGLPVAGVILADQVKNVDWQARRAFYICDAPAEVMAEVQDQIAELLND